MTTQKRPLSGMIQPSGAALPIGLAPVPAVLHTLSGVGTQQGGPFFDQITLFASNADPAVDHLVTLTLGGAPLLSVLVPKSSTLQLLVDVPFASPKDAAPATLMGSSPVGVIVWGWFARPL